MSNMKKNPRVSIVTRTKNRPALLGRAIESALGQTMASWEMVIVNDGGDCAPVDALVKKVAKRAAGRIRVVHNPKSMGMEAASNCALKVARGEFVVIHDDDDSWLPAFLEKTVAHLDGADACVAGVVTHSARITERLEDDTVTILGSEPYTPGLMAITLMAMARTNMFPPIAFVYRRSALKTIGKYNPGLPVLGDWEFNLRFLECYEIEVIPELLANYHIRPSTKSGIYSNTVIGGLDLHLKYDTRLRNELMRQDMREGRPGLGFLVNLGRMMNDQMWEFRRAQMFDCTLTKLRNHGITRFAVCGAGAMGRRMVADAKAQGFHVDRIVDANKTLWGKPLEGVTVVGADDALKQGCRTFVIASLTYAKEMRAVISAAASKQGVDLRVFEMVEAA
jgi:glycosyltransferase involved in cell wall biosynthesis